MSASVLGPLSFLVLHAIASSALASTQTTMVPGSRAVLSMARRGALPARLGLVHPRFKTPWVSLVLLAALAAGWYVVVSLISESAMLDTLSSLGILVAFYYSITGLSCVVYYRRHVVGSLKGFLLVGVGPVIGSIGLVAMLVIAIQSLWDPSASASGTSWIGLSPPLAIAALMIGIAIVVLVIRRIVAPAFFASSSPERADVLHSPFVMDSERPPPSGGIAVDCNDPLEVVIPMLDGHLSAGLDTSTPLYLVFGIEPAEISGDEYRTARESLMDDGERILAGVRAHLRARGMTQVYRIFDPSTARESVDHVVQRFGATDVWSAHRIPGSA